MGFKRALRAGNRNRYLVNRNLSCPIDRLKDVISDTLLLWARTLIQVLLVKGGSEVSFEPMAKVAFSSNDSHATEAHFGVTSSKPLYFHRRYFQSSLYGCTYKYRSSGKLTFIFYETRSVQLYSQVLACPWMAGSCLFSLRLRGLYWEIGSFALC